MGTDKTLVGVLGRPLVAWTLEAFDQSKAVDAIVVVGAKERLESLKDIAAGVTSKVMAVVAGGERRRDSVRCGLEAAGDCDYVVVHDGARPLVTPELIEAVLAGARESGAALCAVPVTDTVKRADERGFVYGTLQRAGLFLAQTPQAFRRDLLLRAHGEVVGDMTDDASMVEVLGEAVKIVPGSQRNVKVTTPDDLELVEALLRRRPG